MSQLQGRRLNPANIISIALIGLGMVVMFAPFVWMFSTSFSTVREAYSLPPRWIPSAFRLDSYQRVIKFIPLYLYMWNSLKITGLITIGQLIFCSAAAYGFARLRFPGRDWWFALLLSSMMIPTQVTIVPIFILMNRLHLYNTHASLILPGLISAFGVFFLRQYFLTIPEELEESARIDGAGPLRIFTRIFIPLSGPSLSALAIITFLYFWNELFRPLIFLSDYNLKTVPLAMVMLQGQYGAGNTAVIMAGASMAVLPVLLVFIVAQRYIVEGIVLTGLKG